MMSFTSSTHQSLACICTGIAQKSPTSTELHPHRGMWRCSDGPVATIGFYKEIRIRITLSTLAPCIQLSWYPLRPISQYLHPIIQVLGLLLSRPWSLFMPIGASLLVASLQQRCVPMHRTGARGARGKRGPRGYSLRRPWAAQRLVQKRTFRWRRQYYWICFMLETLPARGVPYRWSWCNVLVWNGNDIMPVGIISFQGRCGRAWAGLDLNGFRSLHCSAMLVWWMGREKYQWMLVVSMKNNCN